MRIQGIQLGEEGNTFPFPSRPFPSSSFPFSFVASDSEPKSEMLVGEF